MRMVILGMRNLFRNKVRLAIVALLVAVPAFLLLVMQAIGEAIQEQTKILREHVDTALQVRAAGSMGHVNMVGQDALLPGTALAAIQALPRVVKVEPYLLAMTPTEGHNFAMLVGLNPGDGKRLESHGEAGNPRIIAGRDFTSEDQGQDVVIVGQGYARWAGITPQNFAGKAIVVDPTRSSSIIYRLDRPPRPLRILGIYASGYVFGDMQLFMPLETFRRIYGVPEGISWLFVTAASVDHVPAIVRGIRDALGPRADIIAPKHAAAFESTTTRAILRLARAGSLLALALMGIVLFFTTLFIVRERTREIGTLKAIGGSDAGLVAQLLTEGALLTVLGSLVGLALFRVWGTAAASRLFGLGVSPFLPPHYKDTLFPSLYVHAVVDAPTLGLVLGAAVIVAGLGSAYGLWRVVSLSPLEAMRYE
jgi:ABC-type lipoprotein release transport system permease subunit